jgi:glycosyltransferase involved in cell wall biosynthesis
VRIAWIGPTPTSDSGATYVGTLFLRELARAGAQVDVFLDVPADQIPNELRGEEGLRFVLRPTRWRWDRWYNRSPLRAFVSGSLFRLHAKNRLAEAIARRHAGEPYDVVYQFSQTELGRLRRLRASLPPVVVHPSTHAAGELAWLRREAGLARGLEPRPRRLVVQGLLTVRARVQRRDLAQADRVVAISRRFGEHLVADYGVDPERVGVVVNPIDLDRFARGDGRLPAGPLTLLFVSRISVRKGVELVVDLSHRLADLEGQVRLLVVGGRSTWSDYTGLLDGLHPGVATHAGQMAPGELARAYREAAAVLVPSHYEPFGLTVAEALACGTRVVASDEVGAAEDVDRRVCPVFAQGDAGAFERTVRAALAEARATGAPQRSALARAEAERLFAAPALTRRLLEELELARSA